MEDYDYIFKVLLVGNSGTGKTTIVEKYTDGRFNEVHLATIGVDFKLKHILIDDKKVKLQIWDTAGQERFRSITTSYYRGAHGIFIVYDITNRKSFESVKTWMNEAVIFNIPRHSMIIIGNKLDLYAKREVETDEGRKLAEECGCLFFETSPKLDVKNIEEAFESMARILKIQKIMENNTQKKIIVSEQKKIQKDCKC